MPEDVPDAWLEWCYDLHFIRLDNQTPTPFNSLVLRKEDRNPSGLFFPSTELLGEYDISYALTPRSLDLRTIRVGDSTPVRFYGTVMRLSDDFGDEINDTAIREMGYDPTKQRTYSKKLPPLLFDGDLRRTKNRLLTFLEEYGAEVRPQEAYMQLGGGRTKLESKNVNA